jgi:hypothetical protein
MPAKVGIQLCNKIVGSWIPVRTLSLANSGNDKEEDEMAFRTLDDLNVKGKRVLVRADLNVPVADGKVTDATRIERQAPTIRELADKGAKVIVLSHFDRPKG